MDLVIKHVQAKGFKGIVDSKLFILYPHTVISGENSQGKTTIGDAITYCLYGCNLAGNNKTDNLLNKQSKEMYVGVTAEIDGVDHVITRQRKGNATTVSLDNRKINQDELARILPTKQVFLSIFYPEYFLNLSEGDGRALIGGYLQPISKDVIFANMVQYERELLIKQPFLDINVFLDELKEDLKQHEIDITKEEGALEQYRQDLHQAKRELQQPITIDHDQVISLEMELHKLTESQQAAEQDLLTKKEDIRNQKAALWREQPGQKELPRLEDVIQNIPEPKLNATDALEVKLNELRVQWKLKQSQLVQLENMVSGDVCPSCLQVMNAEHIEHVKQQIQQEMQKMNINAQNHKGALEKIYQENQALQNDYKQKVAQERQRALSVIQQVQQENAAAKKQYQDAMLIKENQLGNEALQIERKILLAQDEYRLKKDALEKRLSQLRETVKQAEMHNHNFQYAEQYIGNLEAKIALLSENIRDYAIEKEQLMLSISAAKNYIVKQVELQAAQLKPYLNHVEIKLKEIVKTTGESKDCFKVTYDGKMIGQLSASERIKAALEISQLMKQLSGDTVPLFVDNRESITSQVKPTKGQCMECAVVAGQELLIKEVC